MISGLFTTARCAAILRLLDEERAIILGGPLAALGPLVRRREKALGALTAGQRVLPEAFVSELKLRAERNSRLLLASLAGVRSALGLVDDLVAESQRLRTYTPSGKKADRSQTRVTRETRA